ncbi:hypothetical protein VOLCADRAFT_95537 [Volvox carteri f. nagariensis]|uniref:Uncharacterized protein n=1 Tax=Volvox carteri f. nagariensis TaxID=3068 RepID=D8U7R0_VOLCA|nr:uncharacterized protein VOLCADRAFT_95537 [Volvox carteri f. nagariensis]EFJ44277.1 hypothetical protein VOLCADRAFT_95537 [Volvox carteri f. nagariensis]|eukprot:XP_002954636.1 hypothetical protein VOLCADRAFT_95537 [Volvox carteri f. nagariensis]
MEEETYADDFGDDDELFREYLEEGVALEPISAREAGAEAGASTAVGGQPDANGGLAETAKESKQAERGLKGPGPQRGIPAAYFEELGTAGAVTEDARRHGGRGGGQRSGAGRGGGGSPGAQQPGVGSRGPGLGLMPGPRGLPPGMRPAILTPVPLPGGLMPPPPGMGRLPNGMPVPLPMQLQMQMQARGPMGLMGQIMSGRGGVRPNGAAGGPVMMHGVTGGPASGGRGGRGGLGRGAAFGGPGSGGSLMMQGRSGGAIAAAPAGSRLGPGRPPLMSPPPPPPPARPAGSFGGPRVRGPPNAPQPGGPHPGVLPGPLPGGGGGGGAGAGALEQQQQLLAAVAAAAAGGGSGLPAMEVMRQQMMRAAAAAGAGNAPMLANMAAAAGLTNPAMTYMLRALQQQQQQQGPAAGGMLGMADGLAAGAKAAGLGSAGGGFVDADSKKMQDEEAGLGRPPPVGLELDMPSIFRDAPRVGLDVGAMEREQEGLGGAGEAGSRLSSGRGQGEGAAAMSGGRGGALLSSEQPPPPRQHPLRQPSPDGLPSHLRGAVAGFGASPQQLLQEHHHHHQQQQQHDSQQQLHMRAREEGAEGTGGWGSSEGEQPQRQMILNPPSLRTNGPMPPLQQAVRQSRCLSPWPLGGQVPPNGHTRRGAGPGSLPGGRPLEKQQEGAEGGPGVWDWRPWSGEVELVGGGSLADGEDGDTAAVTAAPGGRVEAGGLVAEGDMGVSHPEGLLAAAAEADPLQPQGQAVDEWAVSSCTCPPNLHLTHRNGLSRELAGVRKPGRVRGPTLSDPRVCSGKTWLFPLPGREPSMPPRDLALPRPAYGTSGTPTSAATITGPTSSSANGVGVGVLSHAAVGAPTAPTLPLAAVAAAATAASSAAAAAVVSSQVLQKTEDAIALMKRVIALEEARLKQQQLLKKRKKAATATAAATTATAAGVEKTGGPEVTAKAAKPGGPAAAVAGVGVGGATASTSSAPRPSPPAKTAHEAAAGAASGGASLPSAKRQRSNSTAGDSQQAAVAATAVAAKGRMERGSPLTPTPATTSAARPSTNGAAPQPRNGTPMNRTQETVQEPYIFEDDGTGLYDEHYEQHQNQQHPPHAGAGLDAITRGGGAVVRNGAQGGAGAGPSVVVAAGGETAAADEAYKDGSAGRRGGGGGGGNPSARYQQQEQHLQLQQQQQQQEQEEEQMQQLVDEADGGTYDDDDLLLSDDLPAELEGDDTADWEALSEPARGPPATAGTAATGGGAVKRGREGSSEQAERQQMQGAQRQRTC